MADSRKYTIGCDFGTLSMRAVLVDVATGDVLAEKIFDYPHGVVSSKLPETNVELPGPHWALQHPQDYYDAVKANVTAIMAESGVNGEDVIAISCDFTTCTILPVDENITPLMFHEKYYSRPHAWVKLWKNHTAVDEAEMMTDLCEKTGMKVLDDYGYRASSEWFFPKVFEIYRKDREIYDAAYTFIEAGDWIAYKLCGQIRRSSCLAAAKAFYDPDVGYPSKEFFRGLDEGFENVVEDKHLGNITRIGEKAGNLLPSVAKELGLSEKAAVGVSHADAAVALVGAGICHPGEMIFVMGTSACQFIMDETKVQIPGVFGVYKDGVLPGYYTYEAGQGGVGDIFDWFCHNFVPENYFREAEEHNISIYTLLSDKAEKLRIGESGLIALDWMNGNRSILQDTDLTGLIMGLTLKSKPEEVFRALIEATAFGARIIMDAFEQYNVPVSNIFACGGLAYKNPFLMQIYADIVEREIQLTALPQTSALSSCIFAAVAAGSENGGYDDFESAVEHMVKPPVRIYRPIRENVEAYKPLFNIYKEMHDLMGRNAVSPLKRLREIQKHSLQH